MKTFSKAKKILFFYSTTEADEYIKRGQHIPGSVNENIFIAMTPSARVRLNEAGIEAKDTLEYFTNDSHLRILEKSQALLNWLRENLELVDLGIGVKQSLMDSFIYSTRLTILYCLWSMEIVLNAVEKHKPDAISASYSRGKIVSSLFVEPEEKYLGHIVRTVAGLKNMKFESISKDRKSIDRQPALKSVSYVAFLFKFFAKYIKIRLWGNRLLAKRRLSGEKPIFLTTDLNTGKILEEFRSKNIKNPCYLLKGPVVLFLNIPNFIIQTFWKSYAGKIMKQKNIFQNLTEKLKNEIQPFTYRDIPFAGVISQKIKQNTANYIIGQLLWATELKRLIDNLKPVVFLSMGNRLDDILLAELCRQEGVSNTLISHGSHVSPKNEYERMEWGEHGKSFLSALFSSFALQSPLAEGYFDAFPSASRVIKTGPLVWGRAVNIQKSRILRRSILKRVHNFEKERVVLHAGTQKSGNALRLHVYETPDEYVQSICELAKAVETIPGTTLIVKFRPRNELSAQDLCRLIPFSEKVILSIEDTFNDVLGMADLLVSFSSTTIEEALQNKIPVLLYGGKGRYQHIPAYDVVQDKSVEPSAIYHVKNAKDLKHSVSRILDLRIAKNKKYHYLFNPYIYAEDIRKSITELLKNPHKQEKVS